MALLIRTNTVKRAKRNQPVRAMAFFLFGFVSSSAFADTVDVPSGVVQGHVVFASGQAENGVITRGLCAKVNPATMEITNVPWTNLGDGARLGDIEAVTYYTSGFRAEYKKFWLPKDVDNVRCTRTIVAQEKIALFHTKRRIRYHYDASKKKPVWREVHDVTPTPAAGKLIVNAFGNLVAKTPSGKARVAGYSCDMYRRSLPSGYFEVCMLSDEEKTLPASLRAEAVDLSAALKSGESLVRVEAKKIDVNVGIEWSKFYPPKGTHIAPENIRRPIVVESDPE